MKIQQGCQFDPSGSGEAHQVDGFLGPRHYAECLFDADGEVWTRSVSESFNGRNCISYRPVRTLRGVIKWLESLGCDRIEVSAVFDLELATKAAAIEPMRTR